MKSDLAERLENKREQYWWSRHRYAERVRSLFRFNARVHARAVAMCRRLEPGMATFVTFALPAATALLPLFVLTLGVLIACLTFAVVSTVFLLLWSIVSDLVHVVLIAAYRVVQELERLLLKRNVYVCPDCHTDLWRTRHKLPAYECSNPHHPSGLRRRHYFLWPSAFGLLAHRCACGARLSAVRRNGKKASRDALVAFCSKCERERRIGIHEFGRLPHMGVAVLAPRSANDPAGLQFMKSAWLGLTSADASSGTVRVQYADDSSANEFANLLQPGAVPHSRSRRHVGAWIWRVSAGARKSLLYLYDSDLPDDDDPAKSLFLEQTSGVVFVVSARKGVREAASLLGRARRRLLQRVGTVRGTLRIPVAVVVQDCPENELPKNALASTEEGDSLIGLAENSFESVSYFPGDPRHSAAAMRWILSRTGKFAGA